MDFSLRQGETLILSITIDDITANTLQLLVSNSVDAIVINEIANFTITDGVRGAEIISNDTDLPIGDYSYMLVVTYADGTIEKLPDTSDCDDDCSLPVLKICEALSVGGS